MNTSNSLVYKTDKIKGKEHIYVTIRLNDECKNGHQDFAITADIYEANKPKTEKYRISGGCCHESILKAFPEFKIFVDLHLADYKGNPMYAVENGFYHLKNGFNRTKVSDENFATEFCEYYRLTMEQFNVLKTSKNSIQYAIHLVQLGITKQWEKQANEAIEILEGLTQTKFIVDSVKSQLGMPKQEDIAMEQQKIADGYYSEQNELIRKNEADLKYLADMRKDTQSKVDKLNLELQVKQNLFAAGGKKAVENTIFYTHTNQIKFNWRNYGNELSTQEIEHLKANLVLPNGVTIHP